jgi:hypothetical protein
VSAGAVLTRGARLTPRIPLGLVESFSDTSGKQALRLDPADHPKLWVKDAT